MEAFLRRHRARLFAAMAILFLLAAAICVVVNLAVEGGLTWAFIPLGAIGLAFGMVSAFLWGGRQRVWYALIALGTLILPFLLLVEGQSPSPGWVWPVGFPIVVVSLLFLVFAVALAKGGRLNWWAYAGTLALAALPISLTSEFAVSRYMGTSIPWTAALNALCCVAASCVLFTLGRSVRQRRKY